MDTAAFGITCNALCPAWTDTPRKLLFFKNHYNMLIRSFFLFREKFWNSHSDSKDALDNGNNETY